MHHKTVAASLTLHSVDIVYAFLWFLMLLIVAVSNIFFLSIVSMVLHHGSSVVSLSTLLQPKLLPMLVPLHNNAVTTAYIIIACNGPCWHCEPWPLLSPVTPALLCNCGIS